MSLGSGVTMSSDSQATVFLLAENRLLREALVRVLSKKEDLCVIGSAPYSPPVLDQVATASPHIVVLDSIGPVLSGPRLIRRLQQIAPAAKMVMVGMDSDESTFLRAIREGAVGYVLKDASALEVAAAIHAVASGEAVCPPSLSLALFQSVAGQSSLANSRVRTTFGLSRREQQLVGLIGDGLTNKEIAAQLNLSEQTVKNHVHRMLRKVGAPDRLAIVERCQTEGFRV